MSFSFKVMSLNLNENQIDFKFIFEGSEFDEKMDRAKLNMEDTGSNFICCLCRTNLGTWSITRTIDEIIECGKIRLKNPDN